MTSSEYLFRADPSERVRAAEELLDEGTIRVLEHLGTSPGWRCLEAGAGGGSIATWLVERVGPSGHVVATDLETRHLSRMGRANLEVRQHDLVNDPLEEGAFDLAHARLLLEHLPERAVALERMVRSLRPGGWLLVEDVDYVSGVPVSALGAAEHAHTQRVRLQEFERQGVEHMGGRHLPARLREAGLVDVGNAGRVWLMEGGSAGARWFKLSLLHLRDRLVATGELSHAQVDRMLELFEDPGWSALSPIVMAAWGRRPG